MVRRFPPNPILGNQKQKNLFLLFVATATSDLSPSPLRGGRPSSGHGFNRAANTTTKIGFSLPAVAGRWGFRYSLLRYYATQCGLCVTLRPQIPGQLSDSVYSQIHVSSRADILRHPKRHQNASAVEGAPRAVAVT